MTEKVNPGSPKSVLPSVLGSPKSFSSHSSNDPVGPASSQPNRMQAGPSYTSGSDNRTAVAERRANYSGAVEKYFNKKVTHIHLQRGKVVAIKDLNNLRKYFKDIVEDNSSTIEATEVMKIIEEAQHYRELCAHGKITDKEWDRLKLEYRSGGIEGKTKPHFLKYMDSDRPGYISWRNIVQMMYPKSTKEEITQLVEIHEPTEEKALNTLSFDALKDLEDLWNLFDDDNNGELDQEEFTRALLSLNIEKKDIIRIYNDIDVDKSKGISKSEFAAWWFTDQSKDDEQLIEYPDGEPHKKLTKDEQSDLKSVLWCEQMKRMGLG